MNTMKKGWEIKIAILLFIFIASAAQAATYYVDSVSGRDTYSGTSTSAAWQTLTKVNSTTFSGGDIINFKCGQSWTGQLWPKGSGASGSPIKIGSYSTGAAPAINGYGAWGTVKLYNQEYWEITNLDISNFNSSSTDKKAAVAIYVIRDANLTGDHMHHIYLNNLEIHNVNGQLNNYNNGGIYMCAAALTRTDMTSAKRVWFEDVNISDCYIHDINTAGFINWSDWLGRTSSDDSNFAPWTSFVMRNNEFYKCSGRALHLRSMVSPLVEYNVAHGNNYVSGEGEEANCFVEFCCDNTLWQYNEVYDTSKFAGEPDGGAFDLDYKSKNGIVQYNYSHNNGMFMAAPCNGTSSYYFNMNPVFRYNISQNDRLEITHLSGGTDNCQVYNNTFYTGTGLSGVYLVRHGSWTTYSTNTKYYNNIFYNLGTSSIYSLGSSTNNSFDYNVFYGNHPTSEPSDAHKLTSDPLLVSAGSGGTGLDSVDGYQLQEASPCRDTGKTIANNGGLDYWGNTVPKNVSADRGAHEHQGDNSVATLNAEADAFVRDGTYASTSYGTAATLDIKTNSTPGYYRQSFLRFNLLPITGTVSSAKLRLHASRVDASTTHDVNFVSSDAWTESVTWNTKPSAGATLNSQSVTATGWIEYDVTDQVATEVAGDDKISVMVNEHTATTYCQYDSREATNTSYRPQLVVTYVPSSTSTTLNPEADAHVRGGSCAGTNYGTDPNMAVKAHADAEYTRQAYLRFNLASVPGTTVTSATLRLRVNRRDATTSHAAKFVSTDSWVESTITWNTKPSQGSTLDTESVPSAGSWIEFDVTSQVQTEFAGDDKFSCAVIEPTITTYVLYCSKEAASGSRPQLVVVSQ